MARLIPDAYNSSYHDGVGVGGRELERERDDKDCIISASLCSEPDVNTILPLPPTNVNHHNHVLRSGTGCTTTGSKHSSRSSSQLKEFVARGLSDSDSEEEEEGRGIGNDDGEGGGGGRRPLMRSNGRLSRGRLRGDFSTVETPMIGRGSDVFADDLTTRALETCKRTVVKPYFLFLKAIGWRHIRPQQYDLELPLCLKVLNVAWPTFVCGLIVLSCVTQVITCFWRDNIPPSSLPNNATATECRSHLLTDFVIPDVILLSAFIYGLVIFRFAETEHLSTLIEAVFLGNICRTGRYTPTRLTRSLWLLLSMGVVWILFSLGSNVFRVYGLHLLEPGRDIGWIPSVSGNADIALRWILVVFTILGFIVLDVAYTAVVVNYCIQCQLLTYLLHSTCDRILVREWDLDRTVKEIKYVREFLRNLNSHLSRATSLLLFIFFTLSVQSVYSLLSTRDGESVSGYGGLFSSIQWISILTVPIIQAARVSRACIKLQKTGLEVRSRPYSYRNSSQLELDSFVIITNGLNMSAKLFSVPMLPCVAGSIFFAVGVSLFLLIQFGHSWTAWL